MTFLFKSFLLQPDLDAIFVSFPVKCRIISDCRGRDAEEIRMGDTVRVESIECPLVDPLFHARLRANPAEEADDQVDAIDVSLVVPMVVHRRPCLLVACMGEVALEDNTQHLPTEGKER